MAKHKCPAFENHERWLVSYADMVTLLFAVFVVLYALKEDGEKAKEASGSMEESFNKPLEDIPPTQRIGPTEAGFGVFDHLKGASLRPPLLKKFPEIKRHIRLIDREMNKLKEQLEQRLYGDNKFRDNKDPGVARIVAVDRTDYGFKVRLLAQHFFDKGSTEIKTSARPDLDIVISTLKDLGRELRLEGHTDSVEAGKKSAWDLSALRASHVLQYMVQKHSFPPSLLSAGGYADTKPIFSNATENSRSFNRRVEINVRYENESSLDTKE